MQCSRDDNKKNNNNKIQRLFSARKKKIIGNNIIVLSALIPRYNNIIYTVFGIVKTDLKTSPYRRPAQHPGFVSLSSIRVLLL